MSTAPARLEEFYPSSDGEPMAETGAHVLVMVTSIGLLRQHYRQRADVYVTGNIFLYYEQGNPAARRSPDVMVVKGVPSTPERRSFKTWEEKAVPAVVIEATSDQTKEEDQGPKKELYERLGVREYFLFDPQHDYLPRPLVGYRLIRHEEESAGGNGNGEVVGAYEELPCDAEGGMVSAELGLRLVPDGEELALFDYRTGARLLGLAEVHQRAEEESRRREQAERTAGEQQRLREEAERAAAEGQRQLREEARRSAKEQRQLRDEAERAAREAAREIERVTQEAQEHRRQREQAERVAQEAERAAQEHRQQREQAERAAENERRLRQQLEEEIARLRAQRPPGPPADPK
jgi:Uma2 family endonuclease